ncbi:hypothetical protein D8I35_05415 [Corticibacter populi]|uniref:Uncharacterized protein n=1 Tax=Corticibacter populi TaxID=1550736 RepID=A0A3M6QZX9_9BURK|nr:hypothetical protein [Corticibacter populi]RMX08515.1 hypothetical protein D8I35_05415 [Corticibacter populi]RZS35830.1 hypothetical protein EV687_0909 [Corticibacter populi]
MTSIISIAGGGAAAVTMTSLELVEFINSQRGEDEAELRHDSFMGKVPKVLGEAAPKFLGTASYTVNNAVRSRSIYSFPKREACLMAMSYSYELQAKVFDRMSALEAALAPKIPQTLSEALRLAADMADRNEALALERDEAIRTKALIGSRREATAMATAAAAKREATRLQHELGHNTRHATIIAVERATNSRFAKNAYVELRRWCKQYGIKPAEVQDPRYGTVKAWPAGAWAAVFGIELCDFFSEVA